jgi:hypothetical protein
LTLKMKAICSPETSVDTYGLHSVIPPKTIFFITTAVRTSNPTRNLMVCENDVAQPLLSYVNQPKAPVTNESSNIRVNRAARRGVCVLGRAMGLLFVALLWWLRVMCSAVYPDPVSRDPVDCAVHVWQKHRLLRFISLIMVHDGIGRSWCRACTCLTL